MLASTNNIFHFSFVRRGFELRFQSCKGKVFSGQWNSANKMNIFSMVIEKRGKLPQEYISWIWERLKNLGTATVIKISYI